MNSGRFGHNGERARPSLVPPWQVAFSAFLTLTSALFTTDPRAAVIDLSDLPLTVIEGATPNIMLAINNYRTYSLIPRRTSTKIKANILSKYPWRAPDFESLVNEFGLIETYALQKSQAPPSLSRNYAWMLWSIDDVWVAVHSIHYNALYFDPEAEYPPPVRSDGTSYPDISFGQAFDDGYNPSTWVNLGANEFRLDVARSLSYGKYGAVEPAFYYEFVGGVGCDGDPFNRACYTKITAGQFSADIKQKFANWYSYYRWTQQVVKTALTHTLNGLNGNLRLGYQYASTRTTIDGVGVRRFSEQRNSIFNALPQIRSVFANETMSVAQVVKAGEYFRTDEPYRIDPANPDSEIVSCRQNHLVLISDARLDGSSLFRDQAPWPERADYDSLPYDGLGSNDYRIRGYDPRPPFKDDYFELSNLDYLSNYAFYYWSRDLRPEQDNVPAAVADETTDIDGDGVVTDADLFWNPDNDPARWQHMTTHVVTLDNNVSVGYPGIRSELISGAKGWVGTNGEAYWHAALNARGKYFNVISAQEMTAAMQSLVGHFNAKIGSAVALSANSGSLFDGTHIYQATFNSDGWTGDLIAYPVSTGDGSNDCNERPTGDFCLDKKWSVGGLLHSAGTHNNLITYRPGSGGVGFDYSLFDSAQRAYLDSVDGFGSQRVRFIRGLSDDYGLPFGASFRTRKKSLLGDIVNSAPLYLGAPRRVYTEQSYEDFKDPVKGKGARTPVVFVGANDGILHAFNASDTADKGKELFGYVPNAVFRNLPALTDKNYDANHKFYVDGPLNEGDVKIGTAWRSVLAGGLGKGGQAVFALDVTDPAMFKEDQASDIVLWEFDDVQEAQLAKEGRLTLVPATAQSENYSADMGYSYGRPAIARIPGEGDGKWVVLFGNGYNNTGTEGEDPAACDAAAPASSLCTISREGMAALYLVELKKVGGLDGWNVTKIVLPAGAADDPLSVGRPNGLAAVTVVDTDADFVTDSIYAGDLFGNVWKILIDSAGPRIAFGGRPLFQARYPGAAGDVPQPITTRVRVVRHPRGDGVLVLFGTGKFLGQDDFSDNRSVQTFYAIWDQDNGSQDAPGITRDNLLRQTIESEGSMASSDGAETVNYRITSNNGINWAGAGGGHMGWYMDLVLKGDRTNAKGERIYQDPQIRNNRVVFVSVYPNADPCTSFAAGNSWVNVVDIKDGSRLGISPFDTDLNGGLGDSDLVNYGDEKVAISSLRIGKGQKIYSSPTSIVSGDQIVDYFADSTGDVPIKVLESTGLAGRSWLDVR